MILLHLDFMETGRPVFRTEPANASSAAVSECMYSLDGVEYLKDGFVTSDANALMFLSDVRGRRFKRGIFLGDEVLSAVETFRVAAHTVSERHVLPMLEEHADGTFGAVWTALDPGSAFFRWCVDRLSRLGGRSLLELSEKPLTVHDAWLHSLRSNDGTLVWERREEIIAFGRNLAVWTAPLRLSKTERAALCFKLVAPPDETGEWHLAYNRPQTRQGYVALGQAVRVFPRLRHAVFTREDAEEFLHSGREALLTAGFGVEVPEGLVGEHVTASADLVPVSQVAEENPENTQVKAKLAIRVDGEVVNAEEIRFLLEQGGTMVFFRNRWIEVDRYVLKEALRALESIDGKKMPLKAATALVLGNARSGRLRIANAQAHGWLRGLLNELRGEERFRILPSPKGFVGELRDYQTRGYSWISFLTRWGFGACLADDMGLGKTVQTIAWLLSRVEKGPALVVAPVSVIANWARELARFAPSLKVYVHSGNGRYSGHSLVSHCAKVNVTLTGYAMLVKDYLRFSEVHFSAVVTDEAQNIKNPETRAAKAVRSLDAAERLALTGTPFENSALDLWALQEFLNPGLLGEKTGFNLEFARPIRTDSASPAAVRLRHILAPFMLRRMKTDPGIASELGPKREMREYCPLSPYQRNRYSDAVASYHRDRTAGIPGRGRSGRMLALLTELKLICDWSEDDTGGKIARLDDLLEEIFENGESALVFTQYAKIGTKIQTHLEEVFGRRFPFLHGSLSPADRERQIAEFNDSKEPCAFILSLKAGGFGLNLTKATHVIHFDRWWNPAVENQATDRAHRIGQTGTVFVHVFITPATLEEHIDEILAGKRLAAGELVGSGEGFLLKMSDEEFARTVELG